MGLESELGLERRRLLPSPVLLGACYMEKVWVPEPSPGGPEGGGEVTHPIFCLLPHYPHPTYYRELSL